MVSHSTLYSWRPHYMLRLLALLVLQGLCDRCATAVCATLASARPSTYQKAFLFAPSGRTLLSAKVSGPTPIKKNVRLDASPSGHREDSENPFRDVQSPHVLRMYEQYKKDRPKPPELLKKKDLHCGLEEKWLPFVKTSDSRVIELVSTPAKHALPTLKALLVEHEGFFDGAKAEVLDFLQTETEASELDQVYLSMLQGFIEHYVDAAETAKLLSPERMKQLCTDLTKFVCRKQDFKFSPYHQAVREPYDYYRLGVDLFRPLVDLSASRIEGEAELVDIEKKLAAGDNVIFLSNHQIEPDPQIISIIFNSMGFQNLAEKIAMLAGHRVRDDPLSAPLSMGRNLICIYSKKHMEDGDKELKQRENLEAMNAMQSLLKKGGELFWVAPSGGRDRPNKSGVFEVSPFDPKTVALFNVMAKKSKRPLHFYPMALFTHPICPPPAAIQKTLGESRSVFFSPVGLAIGRQISAADDMSQIAEKYVRKAYDSISPLKKRRRTASL